LGSRNRKNNVTIPHGGLRTGGEIKLKPFPATLESPSHTVGWEQEKLEYVLDFIEENPSPSHAVGLEPLRCACPVRRNPSSCLHPTQWA